MIDWELIRLAIEPQWIPGLLAGLIFILGVALIHLIPKYKWLAAAILLVVITPISLPGFWFSSGDLGVSDWDLYFAYRHHLNRTFTEFHQFPLWNPWMCGGGAALGDPEFPVFSPTYISALAFGVEHGMKIAIYIATAVGACGLLMLGKRLNLSVYAALLAAIGVAFSTVNLLEVVEGHPNIFSAMWIPWIFWSWLNAYKAAPSIARDASRRRESSLIEIKKSIKNASRDITWGGWYIVCGIFLTLTFFQGGIYLLSYTGLAFLVLILLAKNHRRAFQVALVSGLWALGLAAIKLIPTAMWLSQFQDESYASSTYTLPYLHKILFGRYLHGAGEPGEIIPNQGSGWHEYGAYIGPYVAALAVIGLFRIRRSRVVQTLAISAVLAILVSSAGPILKPVFDHVSFIPRSNVSRIILFAVIPISLLAGAGLDTLLKKTKHKWTAVLFSIAALAFVSGDLFSLTAQLSSQAFVLPYPELIPSPAPSPIAHITHTYEIRHNGTDYTRAYTATRQGYGTNAACNVLRPKNVVRTIHDEGNFGPVLVSKNMTVHETTWTPNRVTTRITTTTEQTEVMLNTNYAKGWWVRENKKQPRPAEDVQGRVGIWASPGDHTLTFFYRPRGLILGIVLTLGTIILAIASRFFPRR